MKREVDGNDVPRIRHYQIYDFSSSSGQQIEERKILPKTSIWPDFSWNSFGTKHIIHVLMIAFAIAGFTYQTILLSDEYFSYATGSVVNMSIPEYILEPDMSLCLRYVDVINGSKPISKYEPGSKEEVAFVRQLQRNITLDQVFAWTPSADKIMTSCLYKEPFKYTTHFANSSKCYEIFNLTKYYVQEFICYRWDLNVANGHGNIKYHYQNLAFPLSYPGLFYGVFLDSSLLTGADMCKVVLHEQDTTPLNSVAYSPYFNRQVDRQDKYNLIGVAFKRVTIKSLPAPYKSNCRSYEEFGYEKRECLNKCLIERSIEVLGKVSFSVVVEKPIKIHHVSVEDLANKTLTTKLEEIEKYCAGVCKQTGCLKKYYTTILQMEEQGEFRNLTILVNAPRTPLIKISLRPKMDLTDFLVYISSCFGSWFGLSVLSLNPMMFREKWIDRKRRKEGSLHSCPCNNCEKMMDDFWTDIQEVKKMNNEYGN